MARRTTTLRIPEEMADAAETVARVRGMSVNALIIDALAAEIDRARRDATFMAQLRVLVERDKEILDRLAQ